MTEHATGSPMRRRAPVALFYAGLGACMALGHEPLGLWWATILALALMFHALPISAGWQAWVGRLWAAGAGYFAASLFWIVEPFLIAPEIHGWMAPFALISMAGGLALFWALAGGLAAVLVPGRDEPPARAGRLGGLVAGLIALEWVRGWIFTGFPWALLGHVLIDTPMAQLAAFGGAAMLSLLALGSAWLMSLGTGWRGVSLGVGLAVAALSSAWIWGAQQTSLPPERDVTLRLAQPNAPQDEKWLESRREMFFARLLTQTAMPADPAPDLVIWPETAVPFWLEFPGDGLLRMAEALGTHGPDAQLAFGVQSLDHGRYFNSLAIMRNAGQITDVYDKHHLVPFGEYIPLGEWLMGTPIGGLAGSLLQGYSPGPGPQVMDLGAAGLALPLICYEAIFPRHLRTETRPDWIMQVTNDAWFGDVSGPFQHFAQARLRAIEQGLPMVRVANTGISSVIDARGGVQAQLDLGVEGFIDAPLPGALPPTFYARFGDWPMLGVLALLLLGAGLAGRTARQST